MVATRVTAKNVHPWYAECSVKMGGRKTPLTDAKFANVSLVPRYNVRWLVSMDLGKTKMDVLFVLVNNVQR